MSPLFPDVVWHDIRQAFEQANSIHIMAHVCPDIDTLGSQLALYHGLQSTGKTVYMHNMDVMPRICEYLDGSDLITHGQDISQAIQSADVVVAVDAGALSRLGIDSSYFKDKILINIDHHASNIGYGDINVVDARYCATGAMIYDLLQSLNITLSKSIAAAIYAAVLTDTASFRLPSMSADAHRMIAELIEAGADIAQASQHIYQSHQQQRFILLKHALENLQVRDQGQSAYMYVEHDAYVQSSTKAEDTEGFIDYPRSIKGVKIAVFLRSDGMGRWKASFRGEVPFSVDQLAKKFGGGGHQYAAACVLSGDLELVLSQLQAAVSDSLNL
ncbi:MAG: bifunctional oligoribonuclease/PAP phosphatase NrnA [Mariprofundaceae bacterium]